MIFERYLLKQALRPALIQKKASKHLGLIVVIPAYDEESLIPCLNSLQQSDKTEKAVEVIVVFNASELTSNEIKEKNKKAAQEADEWFQRLESPNFSLHFIIENELPSKHAGVGLARKIGMDEAVRRFEQVGNQNGVIACFDADSQCEPNYLTAIEAHFQTYPKTTATSIYFEHPLDGQQFDQSIYRGILFYEMHLRYYKQALAYANMPFAFHTVGSSMAVSAKAYCLEGGMNKRKAGEDFYFLQKFIKAGNFMEIKNTKVIPSPRPSHRVPFGTGRAIQEMLNEERKIDESYAWESFEVLKELSTQVPLWWKHEAKVPKLFIDFVCKETFLNKVVEIKRQTSNETNFVRRFYEWFDAFQCLKFMHYLRDNIYPNQNLLKVVPQLIGQEFNGVEAKDLLNKLREIDRS